ncbi:MAG: hypothetical protein U0263_17150 [Polyangiaceae bacterium]
MCSGGPTYPITVEECERWTTPSPGPLPSGLIVQDATSAMDSGLDDGADASASDSATTTEGMDAAAAPAAADATRPCRRKVGVSPSAPDHVEIGCTKAEVIAAEGEPSAKKGESWTYRFPDGCSEFRVTVTVRFARGRVVRVDRERRRTGEFCPDPF